MCPDRHHTRPPRPCAVCWSEFTPIRSNNIYCSTRCKNTATRRRNRDEDTRDPDGTRTRATDLPDHPEPAAVRSCPHCGEPITIVALLTTPQAARPSTPVPDPVIPLHRPKLG